MELDRSHDQIENSSTLDLGGLFFWEEQGGESRIIGQSLEH